MIAPLIKPISLEGGTFYTFSSASEDLGLSFSDSSNKFRFSKYVLLNIPNIGNPGEKYKNLINFSNPSGAFGQINGSKTQNDYLAESFQNYCLNLEALITSSNEYDSNLPSNVSERVFWKWLKEIGAIRYREALIGSESINTGFFVEENETDSYQRVVQQIGDINIINNVKRNLNNFTEVYIYISSKSGSTPDILFKTREDANYSPNKFWTNTPANPLENELLFGRKTTTIHPAGLSIHAHYDSDNITFSVQDPFGDNSDFYIFNNYTNSFIPVTDPEFTWWFDTPLANTYYTDRTFGDVNNDILKIESPNKEIQFKRSRLDGVELCFNPAEYKKMNDLDIKEFGEFNESVFSKNFKFNAVLIYYDLYNPFTNSVQATNLFGILFLDNVDPHSSGGGEIKRLDKYKSDEKNNINGNSYSFKLNLKFDINTQDSAIETIINEYNPYSLELYMESLNRLFQSADIMQSSIVQINNLKIEVDKLRSAIHSIENVNEISEKINKIEKILKENQNIIKNENNIIRTINLLRDEINLIYNNKTSVNIQYNTDVLEAGDNIKIYKNLSNNKIVIENSLQNYNIKKPLLDLSLDFVLEPTEYKKTIELNSSSNYYKIINNTNNGPFELDRDIIIYIDDKNVFWKKGQTFKITFTKGLRLKNENGVFFIYFFTDSKDNLKTGTPFSKEIGSISFVEFEENNNKPIIEIICIDDEKMEFLIDVF